MREIVEAVRKSVGVEALAKSVGVEALAGGPAATTFNVWRRPLPAKASTPTF